MSIKIKDIPDGTLRDFLYEIAHVTQDEIERFTAEAKIELGLHGPSLGQIARVLRTKLERSGNYQHLEKDFLKRLNRLAETP